MCTDFFSFIDIFFYHKKYKTHKSSRLEYIAIMEMIIDLRIQYHDTGALLEAMAESFKLHQQFKGPEDENVNYILSTVPGLTLTVCANPFGIRHGLELIIGNPNFHDFQEGVIWLRRLIRNVQEQFTAYMQELEVTTDQVELLEQPREAFCRVCRKRRPTSGYAEIFCHMNRHSVTRGYDSYQSLNITASCQYCDHNACVITIKEE